ncbi:MAG TPA: TauD/TfdA family dioxygenase [Trebonia sp.]
MTLTDGTSGTAAASLAICAGGGWLEVPAPDGRALRFPAAWLRDNCPCEQCLDPVTGQRLLDLAGIPAPVITAAAGAPGEDRVVVTYAPDGHRSAFAWSWLAGHALDGTIPPDPRTEDAKQLWQAADLGWRPGHPGLAGPVSSPSLPAADWPPYAADPAARSAILSAVLGYGVAVLHGVPAEPGSVLAVAATLGYVRETNYGRLFDVRVEPSPDNLAYTSREILPHTDNPYRDPVPTIQLLHCLRDAAGGGGTLLIDGFAAAALLREEDPAAFAVLTATPWPFAYTDAGTELRACQPLIGTDPRGRIREVRLNGRSMQPLHGPAEQVAAAYDAYLAWARLLRRPELAIRTRLAPGDCLIFDNTRILHARTAFTVPAAASTAAGGTGGRHLQGCYADLDGLASTLAVLRRGL